MVEREAGPSLLVCKARFDTLTNPRTGEEVPIPKKRVTTFRPGKALKEWVEAGPEHRPHHLFKTEEYGDQSERSSGAGEGGSHSAPAARPAEESDR